MPKQTKPTSSTRKAGPSAGAGGKVQPKGKTTSTQAAKVDRRPGGGQGAKTATAAAPPRKAVPFGPDTDALAKAEADICASIESLTGQMSAAMSTLTALVAAQHGRTEGLMRTAPLDRATAMFQRLVSEVVDEQLSEMLPMLVELRREMAQRVEDGVDADVRDDDFYQRGAEMLDSVLAVARVARFEVRVGEPFDTVIHVAGGETRRNDLPDGAVAESLEPGFRTARGKVIAPARVRVNRR